MKRRSLKIAEIGEKMVRAIASVDVRSGRPPRKRTAKPRAAFDIRAAVADISARFAETLKYLAQGIEARQGGDGTAPSERREPGPKDAPRSGQ